MDQINVVIDGVQDLKPKTGNALRFNVLFETRIDGYLSYVLVPGFRLMNGSIFPPMSSSKGRWYQNAFCGADFAGLVYKEVQKMLERKGLTKKHELNSLETATEKLVDKDALCKFIPSKAGDF